MCNLLCCFGFLTCCGCRDIVCRKLVFLPPRPFYEIEMQPLKHESHESDTQAPQNSQLFPESTENPETKSSKDVGASTPAIEKAENDEKKQIESMATDNRPADKDLVHERCLQLKKTHPKEKNIKNVMWAVDDDFAKVVPIRSPLFEFEWIRISRLHKVAAMFIRYPKASQTILFSHGNATDIGCMYGHLDDMSKKLKVNIFAYDYRGYGHSSGKASCSNSNKDARKCLQHLMSKYEVELTEIILYGQSLGSAPSLHLASRFNIGGVVLHCPLTSGLRVIRDVRRTYFFDILTNIDEIRKVKAPIFVIHGKRDEEIPWSHGQKLSDAAPNPYPPWFVDGAGHNDIELKWRDVYFEKVRAFLSFVKQGPIKSNLNSSSPSRYSLSSILKL
eukprot:954135_1